MRKIKLQAQATRQPTIRTQQSVVPWEQAAFSGVYRDIPGSKIPEAAIARAINTMCMVDTVDGRPGTKAWSTMTMPLDYQYEFGRIVVRDDLELVKSGTAVTRVGGHPFLATDVGKYIVWPDGGRDRIMTFVNADNVGVRLDRVHLPGICAIQGGIHARHWSEKNRKLVVQLGSRVYVSDYLMTNWVEVINRSMANVPDGTPKASASTISESQGVIYLFNENGVWRIDLSLLRPDMLRINPSVGESTIASSVRKDSDRFGRRYLTTLTKISGTITELGRLGGSGVEKETMSSNLRSDQIDYSEVWFKHELIDGQTGNTFQSLKTGKAGVLSNFKGAAKPLHGFRIVFELNDEVVTGWRDIVVDLHSVSSHYEIADIIQKEMRKVFFDIAPKCECIVEYEEDGAAVAQPYFYFAADPSDGTSVASLLSDITPDNLLIQDISGAGYLNGIDPPAGLVSERNSHVVGSASDGILSPRSMRGATHYGVYSTKNLVDPVNNPELYVLNCDLPVAKAFMGSMSSGDSEDGGTYTASSGVFSSRDIGDVIRFHDSSEATILGLISATDVLTDYVGPGWGTDEPAGLGWMDAADPGRITQASVVGTAMTWVSGDTFTVTDVGKFVYWDDGKVSQIKEFVSTTEVVLFESLSKTGAACVIDPGSRNFNDTTTDEILVARASVYPLPTRFWVPLPSSPVGIISGGFMFVGPKDSARLFYSQMPFSVEFVAGHYRADYQYHDFNDVIRWMAEFPNMIAIGLSRKTYRIETNTSEFVETPEVGESIAVITGAAIVSDKIGAQRQSNVFPIDNMTVVIFTSDNELRAFDGSRFGENLAVDQEGRGMFREDLEKLHPDVSIGYDSLMGVLLWGTNVNY